MIEITNRMQGPVQLVIRSRTKSRSFACLNIAGRGKGNNVYLLEDERTTEYVDQAVRNGLISTKYVNNTVIKEGE
jgi:hypothetical protein